MNILAVDTSEARGSVALLRRGELLATRVHDTSHDYSEWLLPAVDELLGASRMRMAELDLLAVSTGPGSFTGVRVGLTTVKAWVEVYGKPVKRNCLRRSTAAGLTGSRWSKPSK